ncbi:MAG: proton-conducting transporter membrane subunit [Pseudomonadota bacterium]|nr:proton-conducting transporter membrane subunit [Pseudomonadota bacterium]HJO35591.1 proton-conducting transporter membrane subunit [Gammaproteobacteria bacterium]
MTILFAVFGPLVAVPLIALADRSPNLREAVTLVTATTLFLLVLSLLPLVSAGDRPAVALWELMPGLALAFEVEPLGMLFSLVAAGLWLPTAVYAIGYMRGHHEEHQTRFFACFPIALAAAMGIAFAANMFTLFIFYELLTLATYPLVAHHQDEAAKRGARVYFATLIGTSIGLQLLAIVWTWQATGTLDFREGGILAGHIGSGAAAVLLALYMFGIGKAALMPFHRWLPSAMVAPTPVSALLHAVAVVKAGVFTVLKVVVYVFGLDFLQETSASDWLLFVASFTLISASLIALTRNNLKARLAYSTISQLAYIVLGAALATGLGVVGGGLHIVMHAFGKITLFFCAGAILVAAHKTDVDQLNGLGRRMPITMLAFLLAAISVIGLPPGGGAWSKFLLAAGTVQADYPWLMAVYMLSSLLNIAYLLPIPGRAFFLPPPADAPRGLQEAPLACLIPLVFTALGSIALFFAAEPIAELLMPITTAGVTP